jgi:hypothetical protein
MSARVRHMLVRRLPLRAAVVGMLAFGSWAALASVLRAAPSGSEHVEVSAPILPRVSILYPAEGDHFPQTPTDIAQLAHDAALTFDFLLGVCPAHYSSIVVPGAGDPPTTPAQNATNFEALAQCAYTDFVSKPYWIPALVDQVDICGTELGPSWHLITEDDVNSVSEADAQAFADALTTPDAAGFFSNLYFSLHVWVRGSDGSLKVGDLSPGVTQRLGALPVAASSTTHYESDLALRCIRRTLVP